MAEFTVSLLQHEGSLGNAAPFSQNISLQSDIFPWMEQ